MDKDDALNVLLNGNTFGDLDELSLGGFLFSKENVEYWVSKGYVMDGADYMYIIINCTFDSWLIDLYFAQFGDIDIGMDISHQNPTGKFTIFDSLAEALYFAEEKEDQDKMKLIVSMIDYCSTLRK